MGQENTTPASVANIFKMASEIKYKKCQPGNRSASLVDTKSTHPCKNRASAVDGLGRLPI